MRPTKVQRSRKILPIFCGMIICTSFIALADDTNPTSPDASPMTQPASTQPAAAWVSKPIAKWPAMVLRNNLTLKGKGAWAGDNGFLMKLPTGPTVAVTVSKTLLDGLDLRDMKGTVSSWSMHPITHTSPSLIMRQPAIPGDKGMEFDCAMMVIPHQMNWPVEVLIPRIAPLQENTKVYLVGAQEEETKIAQTVYEGTLVELNHPTPGLIAFEFHGHVPPTSMKGAPLLDEDGHVIGIKQGWYPENTAGDRIIGQAFQIAPVIETVNIPAEPTAKHGKLAPPLADQSPTPQPATDQPPADPATLAQQALRGANLYISAEKYDIARTKLQAIITNYPDTPAAKEAQDQLNAIQGK